LAGGLTPENVGEAIRLTGAPAVDVSSGVETAPGAKDPVLIAAFLAAAHAAAAAGFPGNPPVVTAALSNSYAWPDAQGRFGPFGGRFVAETLVPLVLELEQAWDAARSDPAFQAELDGFLAHYVGRPSPLYLAERLTAHFGAARIWLKRED